MKIKVLILILPSFFKFSIFPTVTFKFSQKLLDLGLWNLWQFCLFSESVTTSDGYRRGYVSFAHFLLYYVEVGGVCHLKSMSNRKSNQLSCLQASPANTHRLVGCYDKDSNSVVAQWLAHLPLVLEVPGWIPTRGEENFGVQTRFL